MSESFVIAQPGTIYGPCNETARCLKEHSHCQLMRSKAATACAGCGQPIGYDRAFYRVWPEVGDSAELTVGMERLHHVSCYLDTQPIKVRPAA